MSLVPVVDLRESSAAHVAQRACASDGGSGFFQVVGHGLPLNDELLPTTRSFFSLLSDAYTERGADENDIVTKRHFRSDGRGPLYRGYFPVLPDTDSWKEGFEIGNPLCRPVSPGAAQRALLEPNVWPRVCSASAEGARVREVLERSYGALFDVGVRLLHVLALDELVPMFQRDSTISTLRLLHYPPGSTNELICSDHVDTGLLTLLFQDACGGLQIAHKGAWLDVPALPEQNALVINLGLLLAEETGHRYAATRHRVVRHPEHHAAERYSIPFFFEPSGTAVLPRKGVAYGAFLASEITTKFAEYRGQTLW